MNEGETGRVGRGDEEDGMKGEKGCEEGDDEGGMRGENGLGRER